MGLIRFFGSHGNLSNSHCIYSRIPLFKQRSVACIPLDLQRGGEVCDGYTILNQNRMTVHIFLLENSIFQWK